MGIDSVVRNAGILMIGISSIVWATARHDYQLVQLGEMARNQFLLDKKTGRIWQKVCDGESKLADCTGIMIWEEMYVSDLTPSNSRPALIYDYVIKQREESEKEHLKK